MNPRRRPSLPGCLETLGAQILANFFIPVYYTAKPLFSSIREQVDSVIYYLATFGQLGEFQIGYISPCTSLAKGGYVFGSVGLYVCLFVDSITQKVMN